MAAKRVPKKAVRSKAELEDEARERARAKAEKIRDGWDEPHKWAAAAMAGEWATKHMEPPAEVKAANDRQRAMQLPLGDKRKRSAMGLPPLSVGRANRIRFKAPLIERLYNSGDLEVQHLQAAEEIRAIHELQERGLSVKPADLMQTGGGQSGPSAGPSVLASLAAKYHAEVYQPWARDLQSNPPKNKRGKPISCTALLTVQAVLVGSPLRQMERLHGIKDGTAKRVILGGLDRWVVQWDPALTPDSADLKEKFRGG